MLLTFTLIALAFPAALFGGEVDNKPSEFDRAQELYEKGDYDLAHSIFYEHATKPVAQYYLGYMNLYGQGVEKSIHKAFDWYKKSADQGYPPAQYNLGVLLSKEDTRESLEEAFKYFRAAAKQGMAKAQGKIGNMYERGVGVEKNLSKAYYWQKKAADSGIAKAQFNTAIYYEIGQGTEKSPYKAIKYYRMAAANGISVSMLNLGVIYARGDGVERDLQETYKWFLIAKNHGSRRAEKELPKVANELTEEQINSAVSDAEKWIKSNR